MPGGIRKRSLTIAGHRTSVSLEDEFWDALAEVAKSRGLSPSALIGEIDRERDATPGGLSSAIRVHVLNHFRMRQQSSD
ncbi:MAG: hypothetical protein Kow0032_21310 [Methyloligellaceae bacterium]